MKALVLVCLMSFLASACKVAADPQTIPNGEVVERSALGLIMVDRAGRCYWARYGESTHYSKIEAFSLIECPWVSR